MSSMKKPPFHDKAMPPSLKDLPRFGITPKSTSSRADSERPDIAFGVRSLRDLDNEFARGFTDSERSKPAHRGPSKSRR
ncbi:hypothetical protein [Bradyrhizobium liaoningense]